MTDSSASHAKPFRVSAPARLLLALTAFGFAAPSFAQLPSTGGAASQAAAPGGGEAVVNGGLAVRIVFIGRNKDGKRLTISAQIANQNGRTAQLALIGYPTAVNNVGETLTLQQVSEIGYCGQSLSTSIESRGQLPLAALSEIQPHASVNAARTFLAADASETQFLGVGMNVAMALGDTVAETAKDQIRNISVGFPLVEF